jgi:HAD superfamily hydrolase (TIGR01509 family)
MDMRADLGSAMILFDLDGTLVDSEPLHEAALLRTLAFYGVPDGGDIHDEVLGRTVEEEYAIVARRFGITAPFREWIAAKHGFYFDLLPTLRPREEAPAMFRRLDGMGARVAVVSNADRMVMQANLRAAGIERHGLITVSRTDVREGKPSPEGYQRAAWLLGGGDAVVVEDSPTGAKAGLAAGFRTLFWPQLPLPTPEGAERIDSLEALEGRLLELVGAPIASR